MTINLLIDDGTAKLMEYFGDPSDVVNKILRHGALGEVQLMDLPAVSMPGVPMKQYKIRVTDQDYLALCEMYGTKSSRISLRRIVYWFFDNEKYVDLGWSNNTAFIDKSNASIIELLSDIESALYKLYKLTSSVHAKNIKQEMDALRNEVWDA